MTKLAVAMINGLIRLYQWVLSPLLGANCRFSPTCSEYAREALATHGLRVGLSLTVKRLLSCHPWGSSGYDPVPDARATDVDGPASR